MDAQKIEGLLVVVFGGLTWLAISTGRIPIPEFFKNGWRRKAVPWMGPLLISFGVFLMFQPRPREVVDLDAVAKAIRERRTLPLAIDEVTRLDDVRAADGALGLFYTVTNVLAPDPEIARQIDENVRRALCANQDYNRVLESDIAVRLVYRTQAGAELASVLLNPRDCK